MPSARDMVYWLVAVGRRGFSLATGANRAVETRLLGLGLGRCGVDRSFIFCCINQWVYYCLEMVYKYLKKNTTYKLHLRNIDHRIVVDQGFPTCLLFGTGVLNIECLDSHSLFIQVIN